MPERKLKDSDRVTLMMAITGLLFDNDELTVDELVEHFKVSREEIIQAVKIISYTELTSIFDRPPYQVDYDDLEDGIVSIRFDSTDAITEVPKLSSRQASAIAAGLVYLSSLPGITEIGEIEELQQILSRGILRGEGTIEIEVVPGSADEDLITLREAITRGLAISCDYLNLRGESTIGRIIEPRRIETSGEIAYLRGWCPTARELRAFRLDRMRNAKLLPDQPISQEAKDAELTEDIYTPSENDNVVVIEVEPEAYSLIVDFKPIEAPIDIDEHRKSIKVLVGDLRNLGRIIARFGGAAKVVEPEAARQAVRDFALHALSVDNSRAPRNQE